MDPQSQLLLRASTGIAGLDEVLGGFARDRLHLVEGSPGTGKTTIALQFLLAGAAQGETGMYVSLAETATELRDEEFEGVLTGVPTYIGPGAPLLRSLR